MGPHLRSLSCLATTASLRGDAIAGFALGRAAGGAPRRYHAGPDAWMCRYRHHISVPLRERHSYASSTTPQDDAFPGMALICVVDNATRRCLSGNGTHMWR